MTKDVWITISGTRITDGQTEAVKTISKGNYFKKNGKHYILYEEEAENGEEISRNTIKMTSACMEIIRKGTVRTHMIFEAGKETFAGYQTPVGELVMGIRTDRFQMAEKEELVEVKVEYSLSMSGEKVSECCIKVAVSSGETDS